MKTVGDGAFYRQKMLKNQKAVKRKRICTNLRTGTLNDMQMIIKISARPSKTDRIDKLLLFFFIQKGQKYFLMDKMKILCFGPNSVISPLK